MFSEVHLTRGDCSVVVSFRNHSTQPNTTKNIPNNAVPYTSKGSETGMEARSAKPYQRGSTLACNVAKP